MKPTLKYVGNMWQCTAYYDTYHSELGMQWYGVRGYGITMREAYLSAIFQVSIMRQYFNKVG